MVVAGATDEDRTRRAEMRAQLDKPWSDETGRNGYIATTCEYRLLNVALVRRA